MKKLIVSVFAFMFLVSLAGAQTDGVVAPTAEKELEARKELELRREADAKKAIELRREAEKKALEARKATQKDIHGIQEKAREEMKDVRLNTIEKAREIKTDARGEAKDIRSEAFEKAKEIRSEAFEAAKQRHEVLKAEFEARREAFKTEFEAKREEAKQRLEVQKAELKERLTNIRDTKKKESVEKIQNQLNELNARKMAQMMGVLDKLANALDRVVIRMEKAATNGRDVSSVNPFVTSAQAAIETARTAVKEQSAKTYAVLVNTETTLRADVGGSRAMLNADLKRVHELVKAAHDAVRKAAVALAQVAGVDDDDDDDRINSGARPPQADNNSTPVLPLPANQ